MTSDKGPDDGSPAEGRWGSLQSLVVVLVRTRNPLNIGAVARAMQNFGAAELRVVSPYELAFQEARSAVGADALLRAARSFSCVADAVADCRQVIGTTAARRRDLVQPVVPLQHAATPFQRALSAGRAALLFGSEKHGLTREELDHCHWILRIETAPAQPSMNLGQAAAVCLWALSRQGGGAAAASGISRPALSGNIERLTTLVMELMDSVRFTQPRTRDSVEARMRQMLHRLNVTDEDTKLLLGLVRKLLRRAEPVPSREQS